MKTIQILLQLLSKISPKLSAKVAFHLFTKVRKKDIRDREKAFYQQAKKSSIPFPKEDLNIYEFGEESNELIILVHGWDSNAGSLFAFVAPLLQKNKRVIALNLPGHADYKSSHTNLLECKDAIITLLQTFKNTENISIISHSFGSAITSLALCELDIKVNNLYFLTSPNKMENVFLEFKAILKLDDRTYHLLRNMANVVLKEKLEDMYIHDKLKHASFQHLYVFHDEKDKIIDLENSIKIVSEIKNSSLKTYHKIGHYRMLWNEPLIKDVISFI
ncbi:hypothetical protein DNU06_01480 [Putridiphycobacter roseus]|uniref:AB hydrolase-1 domain-containing protein n=1 Tax=Putridiphycobacter roseus TaxID=2219161 RepID=A0A2W1NSA5_9FLAO|nr:alpha/beta hydrolase [Putridiphycobacter roseus]PZE18532.1 hypothetical protein DNU06_01480 [Putridiphycobacter roseus]